MADSFLKSVKDELGEVFAGVFDELSESSSDTEQLGTVLKTTHKKVWEIVEVRLKQSYKNGREANGNGHRKAEANRDPESPRKANPFRK